MFFPGETVMHWFNIPFPASDIQKVIITYTQKDRVILEKTIPASEIDALNGISQIKTILSQEESLCFQNDASFLVQLNVITTNGGRCTSKLMEGTNGLQQLREVVSTNG